MWDGGAWSAWLHEIHGHRPLVRRGDAQWLGDRKHVLQASGQRRQPSATVTVGVVWLLIDITIPYVCSTSLQVICYLPCSVMAISYAWTCREIGASSHSCIIYLHIYMCVLSIFLVFWSFDLISLLFSSLKLLLMMMICWGFLQLKNHKKVIWRREVIIYLNIGSTTPTVSSLYPLNIFFGFKTASVQWWWNLSNLWLEEERYY
jgi:hypothetical protein